jgi:Type I phosphodiesterase / nucleotide pyrophosphatase
VVWDGAGRNVLEAWPNDWPNLTSAIPEGAWFEQMEIGSSPSNTPPTHATIGTGAFPRKTGVVDLFQEVDGVLEQPTEDGPGTLRLPTLADRFDASLGNAPLVGLIATLGAHAGLIGHGATWPGGDADLAILRESASSATGGDEGDVWQLSPGMLNAFEMPDYVDDVGGFRKDVRTLDQADGALDGRWGTYPLHLLDRGFLSPARAPYQTRIVQEVIEREGFGADDVPDLLYVNYKAIDSVGHLFSVNGPQVGETVRAHDQALSDLMGFLDEEVGEGEWVMVLTADHGMQLDPEVTGALSIGVDPLTRYLDSRFSEPGGPSVVRRVRPTQIWLRNDLLSSNGHSQEDVAAALRRATLGDLAGSETFDGHPRDLAFAAAFPSSVLRDLGCLPPASR